MAAVEYAKDQSIADLISQSTRTWFSFEYFPPKTAEGCKNLKDRIVRMKKLGPLFIDFTWGAGGSTSDLTMALSHETKNTFGCVTNMHLTCTNMETEKVDSALSDCKKYGICNLVALRGDPPRGQEKWEATEGGFQCALDLTKYIREHHGDYFCLAVAGYPEGHPDNIETVEGGVEALTPSELRRARIVTDESGATTVTVCRDANFKVEMEYLKKKIDAGGNQVITQMFLDPQVFGDFVRECRAYGINVPIVPGIMCLNTLGGLERMTQLCKTRLPEGLLERARASNSSDEAFKAFGVEYGTELCNAVLGLGATGVHFYTLNLEKVPLGILEGMGLITAEQRAGAMKTEADAKHMVSAQGITTEPEIKLGA